MRNINSLKNSLHFKEVYNEGKSLANRYLVMYILDKEGETAIGISVSKKVGNSIVRHRTVRLIREAYLTYKEQIPENKRLVVVARPAAKGKAQEDITSAFAHLLRLHGIIG